MIKKIIILTTAVLIAASVGADAAPKKTIQVINVSGKTLFYKVGKQVKPITNGASKRFNSTGRKKVIVKFSSTRNGGFNFAGEVDTTKNQKGLISDPGAVKPVTPILN